MARFRLALIASGLAACGSAPAEPAPTQQAPAAAPIATAAYPEPPQQHAPWTPGASSIDPKVIAAARRLFEQGLADPRGCEYRAIEIEVGDGWDDAPKRIQTHGWVLPPPANGFAIASNGLVYRTRSIGAAASVTADANAVLDADRKAREQAKHDHPPTEVTYFPVASERYYIEVATMAPIKAVLLLRLGEAALAARVWTAAADHAAPYPVLADDWLWTQYARGVTAHRAGDVALAIESWRRLPALAPIARAEIRGDGIIAGDQGAPYLDDIAVLLADEQRRAAHPAPPLDLHAIAALPAAERIARLVAALDQVAGGPFAQADPVMQALVREGDAAVEPLLAAYETDERRTRARFVDIKHGDADRSRQIIAVHDVAYSMLAQLIDTNYFQPTATDRRAIGEQLRSYWKTWRGVTRVERDYRMLADDKLDEGTWTNAAIQITAQAPVQPGSTPQLVGAALRAKHSPSVTELFVRRLAGYTDLRSRAQMLEAFATWDPAAARPFLATTVRDAFAAWPPNTGMRPYLGEALAALTTARIATGDTAALAEYGTWLATTTLADAQFAALHWLAPLIAHRDAPEMIHTANVLFGARSGWVPLLDKRNGYFGLELIGSDLLLVPAFRAHVLAALADHTTFATARMQRGAIDVRSDAFQQGEATDPTDPLLPAPGTMFTVRIADQYAANLSSHTGAPRFRRYWPLAERDRAIAALADWLRAQP